MAEIKERLGKEFPGQWSVLLPTIRDRLQRLLQKYPLSPPDQEELTQFIANLPDDEAEETLAELEEAADFGLQVDSSLS